MSSLRSSELARLPDPRHNQARDLLVTRQLRTRGWRVLRLWEHELTRKYERRLLARLRRVGLLAASTV